MPWQKTFMWTGPISASESFRLHSSNKYLLNNYVPSTKLVIVMKRQGLCSHCLQKAANSNTLVFSYPRYSRAIRTLEEKHEGCVEESVTVLWNVVLKMKLDGWIGLCQVEIKEKDILGQGSKRHAWKRQRMNRFFLNILREPLEV